MGDDELSLPPLEVLERLARSCDAIERQLREGERVDVDAWVAQFPEAYRSFVRPELQGVVDELTSTTGESEGDDGGDQGFGNEDDRYQLLGELAEGGMGRVLVAWDRELSRRVALKELSPQRAHDLSYRRRFEQEAEITARLDHPGILPIYGRGEQSDQTPYYTMRLVAGGEAKSLQSAIDGLHQLPKGRTAFKAELRQLLRRLIDVSNTVAYAHSRGICHRDLKPANILIGPFGETLVVDWGLAKDFGEKGKSAAIDEDVADDSQFGSGESDGAGTPGFVAPETRSGSGPIDWPRVDVYSLGAILHCVLTGKAPIASKQPEAKSTEEKETGTVSQLGMTSQVGRSQLLEEDADEETTAKHLIGGHKALTAVCEAAMKSNPSLRYAGPLEFAADVERYLSGEPVSVLPETKVEALMRWGNANRKYVIASALIGAIMTAAAGVVAVQQWRHNIELQEKSVRLAKALQSEAMLREQERDARELAERQTEVARGREDLAIDSMRSYAEAISGNETLKNSASLAAVRQELLIKPIRFFEQLQEVESEGSRPSSDYLRQLARTSEDLARLSFEYGDTSQCGRWNDLAIQRYTQWLSIAKEEMRGEAVRDRAGEGDKKGEANGTADGEEALDQATLALAGCYRLKGMMQMFGGDPVAAEGSFRQASEGYASLEKTERVREGVLEGLALLRAVEAIRAAETGNANLAAERYEEAIAKRKGLLEIAKSRAEGGTVEQVGVVKRRETELQDLLQDRAHVSLLLRIGDENSHFEQFDRTIKMLEEKLKRGEGLEHNRLRLAWALHNLGGHRRGRGEDEAAVVSLERSLAIREALVNDYPSVSRYRIDLANSSTELGMVLREVGRYEEAIARTEEGIRGYREMATQMPQSPVYALELAARVHTLGHYYMEGFQLEKGEEAFEESLGMVTNLVAASPGNPAMVALHRELLWHEAERLMGRGEWGEARVKLAELWGMIENGPEVSISALVPIDRSRLIDDWLLSAERSGDPNAVSDVVRLRDEAMKKEGDASAELRATDELITKGMDADDVAATESDRLFAIAGRAYRKGEYGLVQRVCEELIVRWDGGGEMQPPVETAKWEVMLRYAEGAIRDGERYAAAGDAEEGAARRGKAIDAMRQVVEELRSLKGRDGVEVEAASRRELREAWERTVRNAVLVPVRIESGLGKLPEEERRDWTGVWESIGAVFGKDVR